MQNVLFDPSKFNTLDKIFHFIQKAPPTTGTQSPAT